MAFILKFTVGTFSRTAPARDGSPKVGTGHLSAIKHPILLPQNKNKIRILSLYTGDTIRQLSKAELVINTRHQIREIITPYGGGKMRQTKNKEQRDQHYELYNYIIIYILIYICSAFNCQVILK